MKPLKSPYSVLRACLEHSRLYRERSRDRVWISAMGGNTQRCHGDPLKGIVTSSLSANALPVTVRRYVSRIGPTCACPVSEFLPQIWILPKWLNFYECDHSINADTVAHGVLFLSLTVLAKFYWSRPKREHRTSAGGWWGKLKSAIFDKYIANFR